MVKFIEGILIGSENAKSLAEFYREKVGLNQTNEFEMGDEGEAKSGYEFSFDSGPGLYIMDHSEVKGKNSGSERIIFNLEVDDIEVEFKRLKEAGAKVVKETYHIEEYGYVATFADPDGNYFQFVKTRE
jgi:predicted enzyme related to lactoylglutathione lyase